MKSPLLLDCTLRDGSYTINFKFTKKETSEVALALESAGLKMIEVGHGMGLGASRLDQFIATESDETYMQAAQVISKAQWGMFCIPGIATLDDVKLAAEYKMDFIRIGTNIESYHKIVPFIEEAKKHGMFVCTNFMKSYAMPPSYFVEAALFAEQQGADLVYIVDSAGGMLPNQVEDYMVLLKEKAPSLKIGFHGHNNLGLGVANTLKAIECSADIVDVTLQGLGRSAGNTPTEQLLSCLISMGMNVELDLLKILDASENLIQPLVTSRGISSIDVISGLAQFHSSYMPTIAKYASKYRVDPRKLILAVCEQTRLDAPEPLVESTAKKLCVIGSEGYWKPFYSSYFGTEQSVTTLSSEAISEKKELDKCVG